MTCQASDCDRKTRGGTYGPWCCPACRARNQWKMQVLGHSRDCNEHQRTPGEEP